MYDDFAASRSSMQTDDSLLLVAGVDTEAGLSRVLGLREVYEDLLRRFVASQAGAAGEILSRHTDGDTPTACRAAHTLKGLAASLGATPVAQAAAAVEQKLVAGNDVYLPLACLAGRFALLAAAVDRALPAKREPAMEVVDLSGASKLLSALEKLLAAGNADAALLAARHGAALIAGYGPGMRVVVDAVRGYRFEEAMGALGPFRRLAPRDKCLADSGRPAEVIRRKLCPVINPFLPGAKP